MKWGFTFVLYQKELYALKMTNFLVARSWKNTNGNCPTYLLTANTDSSNKLQPFVIEKSVKPHCFRG